MIAVEPFFFTGGGVFDTSTRPAGRRRAKAR